MLEIVFVLAASQNRFFIEQAEAIVDELRLAGVNAWMTSGGFPPSRPGRVYVLFPPHEYFVLEGRKQRVDERLLNRTIFLSAEQPGTAHFDDNVGLAQHAGAILDINESGIRAYAREGIAATHLPLGYTPSFDHYDSDGQRDIDVLFMGCHTPRRARILAGCAPVLSRLRTRLVLSDNSRPNTASSASFLAGEDKFSLLRRASIILNVHQTDEPYFEWARVLDAIHSGCVVVTEHSYDFDPLVPGRHFVSGRAEVLGATIQRVMSDPSLRNDMRAEAYDLIRSRLPLSAGARLLAEIAGDLARAGASPGRRVPPDRRERTGHDLLGADGHLDISAGFPTEPPTLEDRVTPGRPYPSADPAAAALLRTLKEVRLDMMELRRLATRAVLTAEGGVTVGTVHRRTATVGYDLARPKVTVITAVYNHATDILEALDSLVAGEQRDWEAVVVDDGSTDGSGDQVATWARSHPDIALLLVTHPVNRGLPAARNVALDFARGEYVFVLDADNAVYPSCLGDLAAALEADPAASFAYGAIAQFRDDKPEGLVSYFPWDPLRLRFGNYIDAMALFRTSALRSLGGYSGDRRIYGWEDYDLYCRLAEAGHDGTFVDSIVARYRVAATSMISFSNLSHTGAFAAIKEHAPALMNNVVPPD